MQYNAIYDFGLINMNGRVYDPLLAMFTSPDPYIQEPYITQNFNRYAYVLNNPLKYTDPSGFAPVPAPDLGAGVYYDAEEDRFIYPGDYINRESTFFRRGWSSIVTNPDYNPGGGYGGVPGIYLWRTKTVYVGQEFYIMEYPDGTIFIKSCNYIATVAYKEYLNFYDFLNTGNYAKSGGGNDISFPRIYSLNEKQTQTLSGINGTLSLIAGVSSIDLPILSAIAIKGTQAITMIQLLDTFWDFGEIDNPTNFDIAKFRLNVYNSTIGILSTAWSIPSVIVSDLDSKGFFNNYYKKYYE